MLKLVDESQRIFFAHGEGRGYRHDEAHDAQQRGDDANR